MQIKSESTIDSNSLFFLTLFCMVGLAVILTSLFLTHPAVRPLWQSLVMKNFY
ncbi:MAG: hypothetical protein KME15_04085 [Drouetiella hepatica Uher 2000/2452]|jgi:hypothetical protein|uniref:Uncharacterized protein n=1 Tax=Drouetiella hepatica Uher 2000/2452 TaxID=904376 RepID=A0A951ULN1_9CYAN|nr:hypothetical protein [Drouetiella hepatica Uher 2000/2452]